MLDVLHCNRYFVRRFKVTNCRWPTLLAKTFDPRILRLIDPSESTTSLPNASTTLLKAGLPGKYDRWPVKKWSQHIQDALSKEEEETCLPLATICLAPFKSELKTCLFRPAWLPLSTTYAKLISTGHLSCNTTLLCSFVSSTIKLFPLHCDIIILIIIFVFQISGCQTAPWFTMCALSPP